MFIDFLLQLWDKQSFDTFTPRKICIVFTFDWITVCESRLILTFILQQYSNLEGIQSQVRVSLFTLSLPPLLLQNGQTPLMVAAEQGNLEITQELIKRGANVNLDDVVSAQTRTRHLPHTGAPRVPSHCSKQCGHINRVNLEKKEKRTLTFHLAERASLGLSPAGLRHHNDASSHSCFD